MVVIIGSFTQYGPQMAQAIAEDLYRYSPFLNRAIQTLMAHIFQDFDASKDLFVGFYSFPEVKYKERPTPCSSTTTAYRQYHLPPSPSLSFTLSLHRLPPLSGSYCPSASYGSYWPSVCCEWYRD